FTTGLGFVSGVTVTPVAEKTATLHAGQSLSLTAADGAVFTDAVASITNGTADFLGWYFDWEGIGLGTGGMREAGFFHDDLSGLSGIDLNGLGIDEIRLTLDAFYFRTPGVDLNGDGNWTDYSLLTTFEVFGSGTPISPLPMPPRDLTPVFDD